MLWRELVNHLRHGAGDTGSVTAPREESRTACQQLGESALQGPGFRVLRSAIAACSLFLVGVMTHRMDHRLGHAVGIDVAAQKAWRDGNRLIDRGAHPPGLRRRHRRRSRARMLLSNHRICSHRAIPLVSLLPPVYGAPRNSNPTAVNGEVGDHATWIGERDGNARTGNHFLPVGM
jgi:hypothetical protein